MLKKRWLHVISVCSVLFGCSIGAATPARGADILFRATGTFDWDESYQIGFDQLGLDGASFTFTATFSDASHYQSIYGVYPVVYSLNDSLTITGATGAGVNGTYSAGGFGVILIPTFGGQFYGDDSFDGGGGYATWIPGTNPANRNSIRLNSLTSTVTGPKIGDLFKTTDISTTKNAGASFSVSGIVDSAYGQIDVYRMNNFQANVTVVPEPSSLALAGLAAGGMLVLARHRRPRI